MLGISEPAGLIATILLLLLTPAGTGAFWLTLIATFGFLGMQVIYWTRIHPTNRYWIQKGSVKLGKVGGDFFAVDPARGPGGGTGGMTWTGRSSVTAGSTHT